MKSYLIKIKDSNKKTRMSICIAAEILTHTKSGREGTIGCKLHRYPMFQTNVIFFIDSKAIGTFSDYFLVSSNDKTNNFNLHRSYLVNQIIYHSPSNKSLKKVPL